VIWADILSYAVFTGFASVALCAITRVGRGWPLQLLGLAALGANDVLLERLWRFGAMPMDRWLAVCFAAKWIVFAALVLGLSRESPGRRLFLAITYGVYAACCSAAFHWFAYRNAFGLSSAGNVAVGIVGLVLVAAMNLLFVFWILPQMPRDGRVFRWRDPCLTAGVMFFAMFVSGFWPVSVVSAPVRFCVPFAVASVFAWVAFPILCRSMRDRLKNVDVEHSLELMMAEVKVRRTAIDLARRLRHDQRHHRAQIAEYMLRGQYERVFAYLRQLDDEAQEAPTDKLVWCENETVNAILSGASRKAAAGGVAFDAEVHVERTVALPDVELVAVVANLVENAINACGKREGQDQGSRSRKAFSPLSTLPPDLDLPKVTCTLRQREFGIGITVTNPVPEGFSLSDRGLPCAEPGVGMESVRRVVERHGGQWTYELKDGVLRCQVILMLG